MTDGDSVQAGEVTGCWLQVKNQLMGRNRNGIFHLEGSGQCRTAVAADLVGKSGAELIWPFSLATSPVTMGITWTHRMVSWMMRPLLQKHLPRGPRGSQSAPPPPITSLIALCFILGSFSVLFFCKSYDVTGVKFPCFLGMIKSLQRG